MGFEFGPFNITGSSVFFSGSFNSSGSFNMTGSFNTVTGSLIYLPYSSGSFTTASLNYLTSGSTGVPFLYVINGVLYFYNGVTWNQVYP